MTADSLIKHMDEAYTILDKGGAFKAFIDVIDDCEAVLTGEHERLEAICDDRRGLGEKPCPQCPLMQADRCQCGEWSSYQMKLGQAIIRCRLQMYNFKKLKVERTDEWLAILKRAFARDTTDEELGKFYFLAKDVRDKRVEADLKLKRDEVAKAEKRMNEAKADYERAVADLHKLTQ